MTDKVLLFSHLHDKIRGAIDEGKSYTVMGEIIMFTSAAAALKARGFNVKIISSPEEFIKEDRGAVYYILDYLTIDALSKYVLVPGKIHRIRLFCYWGRTQNDIPWKGPTGMTISTQQICTPFPYFTKPNSFLGFVMPDLSIRADLSQQLDSGIKGYLWGKETKYIDIGLVNYLGANGVSFYSTCVTPLAGQKHVTNLGLQTRPRYLDVIAHVDYVLGFGDPIAGPTIIETLSLGKILIAPKKQVPEFLHWHPNIVLTDELGKEGILAVIRDIQAGHKYVSSEGIAEFSPQQYNARLGQIFPDIPGRKICMLRSNMNDKNIFHFLVFEIHAVIEFVAKNDRVDYVIILNHYDPSQSAHRWRKQVLEGLGIAVYAANDPVPLTVIDRIIMDIPLRIQGTMIKSFEYVDYAPNSAIRAAAEKIKKFYGVPCDVEPEGVLLIQRKKTRALVDISGGCPLEGDARARCVYFEDMTFREQIEAISSAKWIIAAHGAAETNIMFAHPSATLIEVNMRPHWYCDPVCNEHYSGKLRIDQKCKGKLNTWPTYHKADYHNLAKYCGINYKEVSPVGYDGRFVDRNPISKERIIVDARELEALINS
jgi:hypothetical protein